MYGSKLKSRKKKKTRPNLGKNNIYLRYRIEETLYQSMFEVRPILSYTFVKRSSDLKAAKKYLYLSILCCKVGEGINCVLFELLALQI